MKNKWDFEKESIKKKPKLDADENEDEEDLEMGI
jgi:hypothetical protein